MSEREAKSNKLPVRVVGEEFPLFDFSHQVAVDEFFGVKGYLQAFLLDSEELDERVPLIAYAKPDLVGDDKAFAFTPFDPEIGYELSDADYLSVDARWKKLEEWCHVNIYKRAPLALHINDNGFDSPNLLHPNKYTAEQLRIIKRHLLVLDFPESSFQARPMFSNIDYEYFYPIDAGRPLIQDPGKRLWEGLLLRTASDPKQLEQIRARFVFLPDYREKDQKSSPSES